MRTALIELPLAAMVSHEHTYALVHAHGETEWTARLIHVVRCAHSRRCTGQGGDFGEDHGGARALAGARSFREAGLLAAELPQQVLARRGGGPHQLRWLITAPGDEKRRRTLLQSLDAAALDALIGVWLAALAAAGQWRRR